MNNEKIKEAGGHPTPPCRAPMMINEEGDVVFALPPHDGQLNHPMAKPKKKPTPLMLCNEISKMFRNTMRESTEDQRVQRSYREILFHLAHGDGKSQLELHI